MAETDNSQRLDAGPKGIGGWLLLVLAQMVLSDLLFLRMVVDRVAQALAAERGHLFANAILTGLFSPSGFLFMAVNFVLLRVFQQRKEARVLMIVLYGLNAVAIAVMWIGYSGGYDWASRHPISLYPTPFVLALALNLALLAYVQTSVRVKNTFVKVAKPKKEPVGIGGALVLPLGFMVVAGLAMARGFVDHSVWTQMVFAASHGHWFVLIQITAVASLFALLVFCLLSVFRKKSYARWLMLGFFAAVVVIAVAKLFATPPQNVRGAVGAGALALASMAYILLSKRVKNTFVR